MLCVTTYLHEGKAQEVEPLPLVWVVYLFVVLGQTDAPDSVNGARFDKNSRAGLLEEMPYLWVLCKFGPVSAHYD